MASCEIKTYSENRIELQNLQMSKKMLEKSTQFFHQSSLVGRKAWMFPRILLELKEYAWKTCGCGQHWTPFDWSFEWKEGYQRWKFVSSVVSDSQISFTWYRRYLMAAIQLAESCCALERTGTFGYVFILTEFKKWWFYVSFMTSFCVSNYFKIEKSWIF